MKSIFEILSSLMISFMGSFFILPYVSEFSLRNRLVDNPSKRRINKTPIPRAGGIGVFFGFAITIVILLSLPEIYTYKKSSYSLIFLFLSLTTVTITGFIDDLINLKPKFKLCGQIAASIILFLGDIRLGSSFGLELPLIIDLFSTIFWLILITNAFNLIDGIDGLATGIGIISLLGLIGKFVEQGQHFETLMSFCLLGSCIAFLRYNYHPAKIFLGDCGSHFIGFFLAAFTLLVGKESNNIFGLWVPILSLLIPLIDTMLAVWRRFAKKILSSLFPQDKIKTGVMNADLEHLHHRLLSRGQNMRNTTATLIFTSSVVVLFAILTSHILNKYSFLILSSSAIILLFYIIKTATIEIWDSSKALIYLLEYRKRPHIARATFLFLDSISFIICTFLVFNLTEIEMSFNEITNKFLSIMPKLYISFACLTSLSEFHSRHWHTKKRNRYLLLAISLFTGLTLSFCYLDKELSENPKILFTQGILLFLLTLSSMYFIRLLPPILRRRMALKVINGEMPTQRQDNILIIGKNKEIETFINNKEQILPETSFSTIAGLICENTDQISKIYPTYELNESINKISEIIELLSITKIIVFSGIPNDKIIKMKQTTDNYSIQIENICI